MIHLSTACVKILNQLEEVLEKISPDDFRRPSPVLSGSTIGSHVRHTLEFFICLQNGCESGVVNYDNRLHDKQIEQDKYLALMIINRVRDFVSSYNNNGSLALEMSYNRTDAIQLETSYLRELAYNIEHAIHHMAIIKIGLRDVDQHLQIPEHFGVAFSTVRYQEVGSSVLKG